MKNPVIEDKVPRNSKLENVYGCKYFPNNYLVTLESSSVYAPYLIFYIAIDKILS